MDSVEFEKFDYFTTNMTILLKIRLFSVFIDVCRPRILNLYVCLVCSAKKIVQIRWFRGVTHFHGGGYLDFLSGIPEEIQKSGMTCSDE